MPTGLGNRKVLTPRSTKAPRRSLPPQAKLIEAASFDSVDSQPSSPDIMTTKLQEKVKSNNANNAKKGNNSSFSQRLAAAAVPTTSNSLAANSGRSKLSTEEFKLDDEIEEKYSGSQKMSTTTHNSNNNSNSNRNNFNSSYKNTSSTVTSNYKPSSSYNNTSYSSNSNTNSNNSYNTSYTGNYHSIPTNNNNINNSYNNPSIINNSFDRWNTSTSFTNGESVELLQEQLNNLRRDYEGLKQRFTDLSRLRLSEPEELLEEHKKLSESRDMAAERTIKALQRENEELKKQLQVAKEQGDEVVSSSSSSSTKTKTTSNDEDESFLKEIEKILKIYSSFSGLKITPSPSSPLNQWHCEFSSRSGRFNFQLIYESDLNRYQYLPETDSEEEEEGGRVKDLPQFLATDILITVDQMQMFFWRLLDTLSKKKQ